MTHRSENGTVFSCYDETALDYILQRRFEVEVTMNLALGAESTI
jgi:hypothetical protein